MTNGSLNELADLIAKKLNLRAMDSRNEFETPSPTSSEDILFKSLQDAADYYGLCYQTISKELEKTNRAPIGNSTNMYKSAFESSITVQGILPKKGGRK